MAMFHRLCIQLLVIFFFIIIAVVFVVIAAAIVLVIFHIIPIRIIVDDILRIVNGANFLDFFAFHIRRHRLFDFAQHFVFLLLFARPMAQQFGARHLSPSAVLLFVEHQTRYVHAKWLQHARVFLTVYLVLLIVDFTVSVEVGFAKRVVHNHFDLLFRQCHVDLIECELHHFCALCAVNVSVVVEVVEEEGQLDLVLVGCVQRERGQRSGKVAEIESADR
mmetsp:Transcript_56173/g.89413  ORF Transcript_56173/g.89413 Transcript_56173/m.89413 type:complete len:220 (+) Transcript_56173:420-1079(+)